MLSAKRISVFSTKHKNFGVSYTLKNIYFKYYCRSLVISGQFTTFYWGSCSNKILKSHTALFYVALLGDERKQRPKKKTLLVMWETK